MIFIKVFEFSNRFKCVTINCNRINLKSRNRVFWEYRSRSNIFRNMSGGLGMGWFVKFNRIYLF